ATWTIDEAITANITIVAQWEEKQVTPPTIKKYSIIYDVQGHGTVPQAVSNVVALPTELPNLTAEGYTFEGWYLDKACTQKAVAGTTITADTTLYAKWEEKQVTPPVIEKFSISYNTNGKGEQPTNVKEALALPEELPILTESEYVFAGWYLDTAFNTKATPGMVLIEDVTLYAKWVAQNAFMMNKAEGYLEGAYLEWKTFADCTEYNVYYKKVGENDSSYKQIDQQLIREYPNKYRADILGLAAGNYVVKVVPVHNNEELKTAATENVAVVAHERSGFAFSQNSKFKTASGAYNDDGTLKSDAVVVYVTANNAKTVTCNLNIDGVSTKLTGIQGILDGKQKANSTQPLCIRFLGLIKASDLDAMGSSSEGLQIKGKAAFSELNITIEGVGEDTTLFGFGFLARNCGNVEFRNFAVMNQMDDGISIDTDNCNIWVHNLDIYYGKKGSGDKAKGDGSVDTKVSTNVTISYNHFWDSGKCNLQGMKAEKEDNYITYHHNWYDHSDSRHPRIRTCTVHIYNNYFDGNAKYGVGVTTSASAFVENNYFRNCKNPMMSAAQGTDALGEGTFSGETGGIIKAYGNYIEGGSDCKVISYQENSTSFDAYVATSRDELVSSSVKALSGGSTYNNFDTNANLMYTYSVDTPEVAREKVMKYAGRVNGGDLKWTFDNATQDRNYEIIPELSSSILSYKNSLIRVLGIEGTLNGGTSGGETGGDVPPAPEPPVITDSISHNFTTDGKDSSVFTITGNLSTSKGSITYKGLNLTQCLKMESSTEITFNTTEAMTLVLVFENTSATIKVDGTKHTASNGIITVTLNSGAHTIKKADKANLFYIELSKSA
ncbi:MAG: InlB B-repeat-containing protein, partial [Anaeroplasma bactoclasticum]|nr:InlB B-repeat-containing protein [Anaeroplasma bactoclasticum]